MIQGFKAVHPPRQRHRPRGRRRHRRRVHRHRQRDRRRSHQSAHRAGLPGRQPDRRRDRHPERPWRHDGLRDRSHPRGDHQLHRRRVVVYFVFVHPMNRLKERQEAAQGPRSVRGGAAADRDRTPRADPRPAREAGADTARLRLTSAAGRPVACARRWVPLRLRMPRPPAPRCSRPPARVHRSCPARASASRGACPARARHADGHSRTSNGCVSVSAVAASGATPSSAAIRDATPAGSL